MEMDRAKSLEVIKRVAAVLLMVCFVLPLSRCSGRPDLEGHTGADTRLYGYEMAQDALRDVQSEKFKGVITLAGLFIVFFVPAACMGLKDRLQAPIYLSSSIAAGFLLYSWVFVFATSAQYGGVIAVICWILIFCTACISLRDLLRSRGHDERSLPANK
ncbi:hypothetical protein [Duganella sp. Root1480D1]|uniref:hypothetical protein n=1 Tax=Duganella sp. Root1480D1 TaxID=1736471 RepID=UPI00070ABD1D|nr:hypothetical protein [Duganella sp. Root1480D1]KQZ44014.1 hypothetical protein ASD58_19930 [Duganella sp. Root1480D1]